MKILSTVGCQTQNHNTNKLQTTFGSAYSIGKKLALSLEEEAALRSRIIGNEFQSRFNDPRFLINEKTKEQAFNPFDIEGRPIFVRDSNGNVTVLADQEVLDGEKQLSGKFWSMLNEIQWFKL